MTTDTTRPPDLRQSPPRLLTSHEAAHVLSISHRHLGNLTRRGILPRVKLGSRVLYRWTQIEAALARIEQGGRD